ncbi:MAG: hypothetical protein OH338_04595 [Candidatus Parvarchaeota archaeon]|nr:hypothetical protein [Candidatus Parvarchaeota archaeon]MCW1294254.1 hypothetical protein [Candidatus Parvarchaeum tengchongense]MCW1295079.1 hypothetical protein [Candidatus Parvarchaeum tengchongense]MCW1299659.1 hypothetical protein [Candidatus Parvarchaeum tengchongense]MCW1312676.1 hypothetical protein [Candidatus Parvarchaeum tengchongense]
MDLTINDSKSIKRAISETLSKYLEPEDKERVYNYLLMKNERTGDLIHALNSLLTKSDYSRKIKDIIERINDELSSKLAVEISAKDIHLKEDENFVLSVKITNNFDVPLVFEIKLEDRDNFLPIIYDKIQDSYFNEFSEERIIDSEETKEIKFKIGSNEKAKKGSTLLFLVIKSKEIEGLNLISRIKVEIV